MAGLCEVCSSEPSKYRCPTCELMSCSLACTQSHKIYCAPKAPQPSSTNVLSHPSHSHPKQSDVNGNATAPETHEKNGAFNPEALGSSQELKDLFDRYPQLRSHLRDIYKNTLEENWVESRSHAGRGRGFARGRGGYRPNRGPWTTEKGFNRGLGRVRKYRERCIEGVETGANAEGFMRFVALVTGDNNQQP